MTLLRKRNCPIFIFEPSKLVRFLRSLHLLEFQYFLERFLQLMAMDHSVIPTQWPKPSHRPTVWVLFLLFVVAEAAIIHHVASLNVLDARLVYGPAQALALIEALDASALSAYRVFNVVDFVFIVLYSVLLVTWFRLLDPDVESKLRGWPWLGLLPGVFDFAVNSFAQLPLPVRQGQFPILQF